VFDARAGIGLTKPTAPSFVAAACALVTNAEGEILLVRTHKRGWEIPGGQVEQGETLIEAAVRETQEEAGVTIEVKTLVTVQSNLTRNLLIFGFLAAYISGELATSSETPEVRWAKCDEVLPLITHPAIHQRVDYLLNYDGRVVYHAYHLDPYQVVSEMRV
jgi:8-oxo-dGTP diphosphatase